MSWINDETLEKNLVGELGREGFNVESRQLYKPGEREKDHLEDFELTFNQTTMPNDREIKQMIISYYTARGYVVRREHTDWFAFFIAKKGENEKLLINVTPAGIYRAVSVIDLISKGRF